MSIAHSIFNENQIEEKSEKDYTDYLKHYDCEPTELPIFSVDASKLKIDELFDSIINVTITTKCIDDIGAEFVENKIVIEKIFGTRYISCEPKNKLRDYRNDSGSYNTFQLPKKYELEVKLHKSHIIVSPSEKR